MSYTFSVSYQNITKKVTCPRSGTINDVIHASFEKFKLPNSSNGHLLSGGKNLDALLPIRHTNLVNNAKLVLSITRGNSEVNLKVTASIGTASVTKILKISSSETLEALVDQFRAKAEINDDWTDQRIQLGVMQTVKDNLSCKFSEVSVASLVGSSTNAVIRLVVENKDKQLQRAQLQEEQRVLREKFEEKQRQERLLQREKEEATKLEDQRRQASEDKERGSAKEEDRMEVDDILEENKTSGEKIGVADTELLTRSETLPKPKVPITETTGSVSLTPMVSPSHPHNSFQLPEEKEDTLYVPKERTTVYENPEEDYNITMGQAEKYYKMIKSMQGPAAKKELFVPQKYIIRIRFPDRSLLDLPIEDSSVKLGQLLKKVDGYVDEKFINSYKLRNGSPPFKEIVMGFSENNLSLKNHPDFQQEKLLLIWEPATPNTKGPFLKPGIATKDASELPTVVLEANRGSLEKEEEKVSGLRRSSTKPKQKGLPKWFRP